MTTDKNLDKMESIFNVLKDSISKEEFVAGFKALAEAIRDITVSNEKDFALINAAFDALSEKVKTDAEENIDVLKSSVDDFMNDQLQMLVAKADSLRDGVDGKDGRDGKDGNDGHTPTERELLSLIKPLIPKPVKGEKGEKGEPGARIGWGAHPVMIQGLGVVIDKNVRTINFKGNGLSSVTRRKDGVVEVTISGGGSGGTLVSEEVPTDSGDHINFTLAQTPLAGTLRIYRGGARQASIGASPDFSSSTNTITLTTPLNTADGEVLFCDYEY